MVLLDDQGLSHCYLITDGWMPSMTFQKGLLVIKAGFSFTLRNCTSSWVTPSVLSLIWSFAIKYLVQPWSSTVREPQLSDSVQSCGPWRTGERSDRTILAMLHSLCRFKLHSLGSKIQKIPEFNLHYVKLSKKRIYNLINKRCSLISSTA